MSITQSIELFVVINLIVVGASHLFRPRIWIAFFKYLYSAGHAGNIFNAMLSLGMGSIIISFHLVWEWPMVIVTVYGGLLVIKGAIYMVFPEVGLESIGKINDDSPRMFRIAGVIMIATSGLLCYYLFIT